jgi:glycosyltransferase involved in cell wall biosynthesis
LNICILSGSYKPGKCGISDYIKLISGELQRYGNKCNHIAIDEGNTLSDIAQNLPYADLYSIQFAPYAFSSSGLSKKGLITFAKSLKNKNTHINFHEIWIGAYPSAKWKEKTIGWLQKREIVNFINICNPSAITCSNSAALDRLHQAGIDAKVLYLFGNIPYSPSEKHDSLNHLNIVFFGTLYGTFPYDQLAKTLISISQYLRKQIYIKIIGRQREGLGLGYIKEVSQEYGFAISISGELSISKISEELQRSDLGVSTTPYDILGKSGATAAMLEHGLPIISYDDGDTPSKKLFTQKQFTEQIVLLNDKLCLKKCKSLLAKPRKQFFHGVKFTAGKLIDMAENISTNE